MKEGERKMTYSEFIQKYGDEEVVFSSYYKYAFSFAGKNNLIVHVGGNQNDIYRMTVEAGKKYNVFELDPYAAYLNDERLFFDSF